MSYKIRLTKQVSEYLEKIDANEEERILKRIRKLTNSPKHYLERKDDT